MTLTMLLTTMMEAERRSDDEGEAERAGGDVRSVALLLHDLSPGDYSARNPTVGIAAMRIVPSRARGLLGLQGNPPIPLRRNGLTAGKGTPRITNKLMPGGVRSVKLLLILILITPPSPL